MATSSNVRILDDGIREVLNSQQVRDDLTVHAQLVLAAARGTAPVKTGAYRDSLRIEQTTTDRVSVHVVAGTDHAMYVEAETGNLARALDHA